MRGAGIRGEVKCIKYKPFSLVLGDLKILTEVPVQWKDKRAEISRKTEEVTKVDKTPWDAYVL